MNGEVEACVVQYTRSIYMMRIARTGTLAVILILLLPLYFGLLSGATLSSILALISSTLIFQAAAAAVGLRLGIPPLTVLLAMTTVAIGVMILILEITDLFSGTSPRIASMLHRINEHTREMTLLRRYGPVMLIPVIWIPGIALYGAPLVAWLLQWRRDFSLLCMCLGWVLATLSVMAAAIGINVFFP
ncbi:MAG: hypothetical protein RQ758_07950 [Methanomicrobiaceae archaeon]|nr:hypothetical protein [Methanomicrobiaceae archaeon]